MRFEDSETQELRPGTQQIPVHDGESCCFVRRCPVQVQGAGSAGPTKPTEVISVAIIGHCPY